MTRRQLALLMGGGSAALAAQHGGINEALRSRRAPDNGVAAAHPAGEPASAQAHKPASSPEEIWAELMAGNRRFVAGQPRQRALVRARQELVSGQHPHAIVLGCADSRVSPELIFDKNLGELFVVRTAGNVADPVALGSLEYAAEHLHCRLLVVLGHESCGAVAAAVAGGKMPTPGLEAIVGHITPAIERVKTLASGDELARLVVTMNIHQSASDLLKNSPILSQEAAEGKLLLVKALYRLSTGEIARL